MNYKREKLTDVFLDTEMQYTINPKLVESKENSCDKTIIYFENQDIVNMTDTVFGTTSVSVSKCRTFESAKILNSAYPHDKIAVLNFASATNPGGGVKNGSSAQEEQLCRCSTLYPTLAQTRVYQSFYQFHRDNRNNLHTDDCIYSPEMIVFKSDEDFPKTLNESDWFTVDIISCAAPNLRENPNNKYNDDDAQPVKISDDDLTKLHEKRARRILDVARANGVSVLVLGAFGCGAFKNNPVCVATAYRNVLDEYKGKFKHIEFAVFCRDYEDINYKTFKEIIENKR